MFKVAWMFWNKKTLFGAEIKKRSRREFFCSKIPKIENILELVRDSLFLPLIMLY